MTPALPVKAVYVACPPCIATLSARGRAGHGSPESALHCSCCCAENVFLNQCSFARKPTWGEGAGCAQRPAGAVRAARRYRQCPCPCRRYSNCLAFSPFRASGEGDQLQEQNARMVSLISIVALGLLTSIRTHLHGWGSHHGQQHGCSGRRKCQWPRVHSIRRCAPSFRSCQGRGEFGVTRNATATEVQTSC